MMLGAVKCDNCGYVEPLKDCGRTGVSVSYGWLKVTPLLTFTGTSHAEGRTKEFQEKKQKVKSIIKHSHYCPACVEKFTGDSKVKIEWSVVMESKNDESTK